MNIAYLRTILLTNESSYDNIFWSVFKAIQSYFGRTQLFRYVTVALWILCESKMTKSRKHFSVHSHGIEVHLCLNLCLFWWTWIEIPWCYMEMWKFAILWVCGPLIMRQNCLLFYHCKMQSPFLIYKRHQVHMIKMCTTSKTCHNYSTRTLYHIFVA